MLLERSLTHPDVWVSYRLLHQLSVGSWGELYDLQAAFRETGIGEEGTHEVVEEGDDGRRCENGHLLISSSWLQDTNVSLPLTLENDGVANSQWVDWE
jgi:hypothetical protein